MEGVGRLPRGCGEDVWRVWESYLLDVGRLSEDMAGCLMGVGTLSAGCGQAVCRVSGGYVEPVWRCAKVVWRV